MSRDENPWIEYERRKQELLKICQTTDEYEDAIRKLLAELGL